MAIIPVFAAATCIAIYASAAFADDLLDVQKFEQPNGSGRIFELEILSKADNLMIKDVIINRGNCGQIRSFKIPRAVQFGDKLIEYNIICNPIDVRIITDRGDIKFTWDDASVISVTTAQDQGFIYFNIASHYDGLLIENIIGNRGNCKFLGAHQSFPVKLDFGLIYSAGIICDPIEIQVVTSRGTFTFTRNAN